LTRTSSCSGWRRNSDGRAFRSAWRGRLNPTRILRAFRTSFTGRGFSEIFRLAVRAATVLLALVSLAGPVGAVETDPVEYMLGAGDEVRVTVFGQDDLSGTFQVDGSGTISLPLIGKVKAGGRTVRETEIAIVGRLKPDYLKNPRVSLEVMNYRPFYIIGEVKKPGSYPYVNGMTVVNAIALGGGYTYRARENNIYLTRAKDQERKKQPASHDTLVLPGDIIEVPERYF